MSGEQGEARRATLDILRNRIIPETSQQSCLEVQACRTSDALRLDEEPGFFYRPSLEVPGADPPRKSRVPSGNVKFLPTALFVPSLA